MAAFTLLVVHPVANINNGTVVNDNPAIIRVIHTVLIKICAMTNLIVPSAPPLRKKDPVAKDL